MAGDKVTKVACELLGAQIPWRGTYAEIYFHHIINLWQAAVRPGAEPRNSRLRYVSAGSSVAKHTRAALDNTNTVL